MSEQTGALDGALDKTLDSNKVNLLTWEWISAEPLSLPRVSIKREDIGQTERPSTGGETSGAENIL